MDLDRTHSSLTEAPSLALDGPGSASVSCLLMEDAVAADAVKVASSNGGVLTGRVALFANPFLDGKEEALAVDDKGFLTYLQRTESSTGWAQRPVTGGAAGPLQAAAVVVVVHPLDLSIWAIYSPRAGGPLQALRLVGPGSAAGAHSATGRPRLAPYLTG